MNYITSCPECNTQFLISQEHLKAYRGKVQCGHCNHVFNAKNRLSKITEEDEAGEQAFMNTAFEEVAPEPQPEATTEAVVTVFGNEESATEEIVIPPVVETPPEIEDLTTEPRFAALKKKTPWWFYLASTLLLLIAGLQGVYFMRTQIAANYPQFKPLLVNACAQIGCKVELPRNLELLLIDDSDMQEDETYQSVINFSSTLINNANFIQAYPNIELTLTDTHDEAVIRTLLKPTQYLKAGTNLEEGLGAHQEIRVNLPIHVNDVTVAGYRVQLNY